MRRGAGVGHDLVDDGQAHAAGLQGLQLLVGDEGEGEGAGGGSGEVGAGGADDAGGDDVAG